MVIIKNSKRNENATAGRVRQCTMNYMVIAWLATLAETRIVEQ